MSEKAGNSLSDHWLKLYIQDSLDYLICNRSSSGCNSCCIDAAGDGSENMSSRSCANDNE